MANVKLGKSRTNQPVEVDANELYDDVVELVNAGIEEGDISAGGTQLYKHTFVFEDFDLYIISTTSTSYADEPKMFGFIAGTILNDSANIISLRVKTRAVGSVYDGCPAILGSGAGYYYAPDKTTISFTESVMDTVSTL